MTNKQIHIFKYVQLHIRIFHKRVLVILMMVKRMTKYFGEKLCVIEHAYKCAFVGLLCDCITVTGIIKPQYLFL